MEKQITTNPKFKTICTLKENGAHQKLAQALNSLTSCERKEFNRFLPTYHFYEEQETTNQIVEDICYFATITKTNTK